MSTGNIILIGPMGAGKTTLGKKLANRLKKLFIDVDDEIEKYLGVDIPTIFDQEGESGFRERERQVLKHILKNNSNTVIATGGGCVLTDDNRRLIRCEKLVIHIDIDIENQYKRLKLDNKRPILQVPNLKEKLKQLRKDRHEIYVGLADVSFSTSRQSAKYLIDKIVKELD